MASLLLRKRDRGKRTGVKVGLLLVVLAAASLFNVMWSPDEEHAGAREGPQQEGAAPSQRQLLGWAGERSSRLLMVSKADANDTCSPKGLKGAARCSYLRHTDECQPRGRINYLVFYYCGAWEHDQWASFIVFIAWLIVLFYLLGATADDFLCPALANISEVLNIPADIAGLTFLAFGNGAPDVFGTFVAVKGNKFDISAGELLGAGMFVTTVVVGSVGIATAPVLQKRSFLRDTLFYAMGIFVFVAFILDGKIELYESIILFIYYCCYVIFAVAFEKFSKFKKKRRKGRHSTTRGTYSMTEPTANSGSDYERQPLLLATGSDDDSDYEGEASARATGEGDGDAVVSVGDQKEPVIQVMGNTARSGSIQAGAPAWQQKDVDESSSSDEYDEELDAPDIAEGGFAIPSLEDQYEGPIARLKSEWTDRSIVSRIGFICTFVILIPLRLTVPQTDEEDWNRGLTAATFIFSPSWFLFALGLLTKRVGPHNVPIFWVPLLVGVIVAALVYFKTEDEKPPRWNIFIVFWAFIVSVVWIYMIANELVELLVTFGLIFTISELILGATVLAWGDSVGDLVADVVMARQGFPGMAIAAAYGGPLFNLLFGSGLSLMYVNISRFPKSYVVEPSAALLTTAGFVLAGLVSSVVVVTWNRFKLPRKYAIYLISLYATFSVIVVLMGVGVIPNPTVHVVGT